MQRDQQSGICLLVEQRGDLRQEHAAQDLQEHGLAPVVRPYERHELSLMTLEVPSQGEQRTLVGRQADRDVSHLNRYAVVVRESSLHGRNQAKLRAAAVQDLLGLVRDTAAL